MDKPKSRKESSPEPLPSCIGSFFLDSGAFSLYDKLVLKRGDPNDFSGYDTPEFWEYVDRYAEFIKANLAAIDFYANIDVIRNPERTWNVQKYLEDEHGLLPVPVVHYGESLKWLDKYIKRGHEFIGIGGLAKRHLVGRDLYCDWIDRAFEHVCPKSNGRKPIIRLHGFAVTAYDLLIRYPWWSVDSASWVKAGGFGSIYVPLLYKGKFAFHRKDAQGRRQPVFPHNLSVSMLSPARKEKDRSIHSISKAAQGTILQWLDQIEVPLGSVDEEGEMVEWGVVSHHGARKIANLKFFEAMCNSLPEWPWAFRGFSRASFLESM